MSFQLMAWAIRQEVGSTSEKFVLLALADRANSDTGLCCPRVEQIAEDTEMHYSTVQRALKALADKGFVKRSRRRRDDGSLGVYDYEFQTAFLRSPPGAVPASPPGAVPGQEPRKDLEPIETPPSETSLVANAVSRIYECWRIERGKSRATYDSMSPARRKKIESRLKEFTEAELIQAIRSVAADPWPERPRHDDLTVIFRSREQVERFLEMGEGSPLEQFHDHATQAVANARRRNAR